MVIIELHPTHAWIWARQGAERRHTTSVNVERADGEEIKKQPVRGVGRVGDMLGECGVVSDRIERGRIEFREGWMGILAMETFLIAIDPDLIHISHRSVKSK